MSIQVPGSVPIKTVPSVDEITAKLEAAIFRGEYAPGTKIREARLATELGVSRRAMREAVRRLEGRKLIVHHANHGASVAQLSRQELCELLELRECLEVAACRLAAEKIDHAHLTKLRQILVQHQTLTVDRLTDLRDEWHDLDFHYQLAHASGNGRLIDLLCGDIWGLLRLYRYPAFLSPGISPGAHTDHEAILDALAARDPEACERVMRRHLAHTHEALLRTTILPGKPKALPKKRSGKSTP